MIQRVHRIRRSAFFLRAILLLTSVAALANFETLERIDAVLYDRISTIHRDPPGDDIVIAAIDEASLQLLGRWPWPRSVHAELLQRLKNAGTRAVALDLLFAEPQSDDPDADLRLAAAIAGHGAVILPVAPAYYDAEEVQLIEPLGIFQQHAQLGHTDIELDGDGIARRVFLKAGIEYPDWPALGLVLAAQAGNRPWITDSSWSNHHAVTQGRWVRAQEALIPYIGPAGSFQQVPYAQVLFDDQVLARLRDKIVLVGMTATGLGTRFATPVSPINRQPMSGIEWHANVLSMLLHERAILPLTNRAAGWISVVWVAILLLACSAVLRTVTIPLVLALLGCGLLLAWFSLLRWHVWFPPAAAIAGTLAIYPLMNWRRINEFMQSLLVTRMSSSTALESVGDGVITTDAQDHILHMNKGAERILGLPQHAAQGILLSRILNISQMPESSGNGPDDDELSLPASAGNTIQCYVRATSGEKRAVRLVRHALRDEQQALMGYVIALADITDTVELSKQVAYQASYDPLTRLPNRALLLNRFNEWVAAARPAIIVFFVTLDNFKKINDALGHRAGDELLKMLSQRLAGAVDADTVVARWGGDEFVLLFDSLGNNEAAAHMAHKILAAIRHSFHLLDQDVFVTVSIGISRFPDDSAESEAVLERASTAMHRVKNEGGNSFGFYSTESSVAWTRDRLELERELRAALTGGGLQVFYQPIVDVYQRRIVRMEALVRWPHPVRGFLSPGDFIPLAESVGLMEQLGEEVLRTACHDAQHLQQAGQPVPVSVNVHPRQLQHGHFADTLSQVLSETRLPPTSLILEITESAIVSDMERASAVLASFKALGVLIALDDFGTGYSSLTLLRELPIDIIKIDKSFTRTLDQNQSDLTITQAIIGLGVNLGLAVIAEGVESEWQVRILLDNRCHLQQGYYFSRPVPYGSIAQLINDPGYSNPVSIARLCSEFALKPQYPDSEKTQ